MRVRRSSTTTTMPSAVLSGLYIFVDGGSSSSSGQFQPVPLQRTRVLAKLVDFCVEVAVVQTYINLTLQTMEDTVFVFPLDERAAVCGFEVTIDGKTTVGEVQEKQQAEQTYVQAVARGDSAQLLEQKRADVFQMRVGNLQPGQQADIKITYVADMKIEEDAVRLLVPTSVAPRYHPWTESDPIPRTGSLTSDAQDGLELRVVCMMPTKITRVHSPSHSIVADLATATNSSNNSNSRICVVTLQGSGATHLDKDFVLLVAFEEPHRPRLAIEKGADGSHACMITLAPKLRLDEVPAEFVFVVDRSGSMGGKKMEQAVAALQLFLRSLPADCYFNIVSFGDRFSLLFSGGSHKNGSESLRAATKDVSSMTANYGGTEILKPLKAVLEAPLIKNYERQVFLLTDGQVSNTAEVIKYVESKSKTARCFTLGLGDDASHELVEGIARAGRGLADFALIGERLETKVLKQLECAMQPSLRDVYVDWTVPEQRAPEPPKPAATAEAPSVPPVVSSGGGVFDAFKSVTGSLLNYVSPRPTQAGKLFVQAPHNVPPVFSGSRFLIYCLLPAGVAPPTKAVVHAHTPDGVLAVELVPTPADFFEGKVLHTLAARELIRDLEEGRSFMHKDGAAAHESAVKAEIVRLGVTYKLTSSQTSFVAVEPGTKTVVPLYYGPVVFAAPAVVYASSSTSRVRRSAAGGAVVHSFGAGGMPPPSAACRPASFACSAAAAPPPPGRGGFFGGFGSAAAAPKKKMSAVPMSMSSSGSSRRKESARMQCEAEECKMAVDDEEDADMGGALFDSLCAAPSAPASSAVPASNLFDAFTFAPASAPAPAPAGESPSSKLASIAMEQDFDGSFTVSPKLAKTMGVEMSVLEKAPACCKGDKTVWTAVLVLAFFSKRLASLQDDWTLLAKKARKWILTKVDAAALAEATTAAEAVF
eukprot:m.170064 g.170064  ORF g.170064 m.170064 type:complete len:931 (+) comp17248_c0_seq2:123-2915(+)